MVQIIYPQQAQNPNFAQSNKFSFVLPGLKSFTLFGEGCNLPGISSTSAIQSGPKIDIKRAGDKLVFLPLVLNFKVDEDYRIWEEVFKWFVSFAPVTATQIYGKNAPKGIYQDGILELQNNSFGTNLKFLFRNCHPIDMADVELTYVNDDNVLLLSSVTIDYDYYEILR